MCQEAMASDLPFYDIFAPQKVPFFKISDDVIACDLWFGPPIKNPGYAYACEFDFCRKIKQKYCVCRCVM